MKSRITVEDSLTEYFEYIQQTFHEKSETELRHLARTLVGEYDDESSGFIAPLMAVSKYRPFNPNLHLSGQEEQYWVINNKSYSGRGAPIGGRNISDIEIIYTGMRLHENYPEGEAQVWWEFAKDQEGDPRYRELERDYAFYQETGLDPIASPEDARAKGAIAEGVRLSKDTLLKHSALYLKSIMVRGNGDIPPTLI